MRTSRVLNRIVFILFVLAPVCGNATESKTVKKPSEYIMKGKPVESFPGVQELEYAKTVTVPDFAWFDKMNIRTVDRQTINKNLGSPASSGFVMRGGNKYKADYYLDWAGKFDETLKNSRRSGVGSMDFGLAYLNYKDNGQLNSGFYYRREKKDGLVHLRIGLDIHEFIKFVEPGVTHIDDIVSKWEKIDYHGKMFTQSEQHNLIVYCDNIIHRGKMRNTWTGRAKPEPYMARWIKIAYDDDGIVQTFAWGSSKNEDLKKIQNLASKDNIRPELTSLLKQRGPSYTSSANIVEPEHVEEVIEDDPQTFQEVRQRLGTPTSIGMWENANMDHPYLTASWTWATKPIIGKVKNYIPTSLRGNDDHNGKTYNVEKLRKYIFSITYTGKGEIVEKSWYKPQKDDKSKALGVNSLEIDQ